MYHQKQQDSQTWGSDCLIQEQVKALRKRIESDKRQLHDLESQLHENNGIKSSSHIANWEVHLRDNPTFQDKFDAMDSYFRPPSSYPLASKSQSNRSKMAKSLFKECQKRIRAAESLLEQANTEV